MQSNELKIRCVVPCLLGLESLIAQELRDMGAIDVAAENGRVLFPEMRIFLRVPISIADLPSAFKS